MTPLFPPVKMTELGLPIRIGMFKERDTYIADIWVGEDREPNSRLRCTGQGQHATFTQARDVVREEVMAGLWPEALTSDKWAAALHRLYLKEHEHEYREDYDPEAEG